jgi:hypothetical protein
MTRSEMSSTLTVWYNTKCPVCNTGIEWQHRRLLRAARAGVIEFRDINLEPDVLSRFGAGVEDVRRRLHAVDAEGTPRDRRGGFGQDEHARPSEPPRRTKTESFVHRYPIAKRLFSFARPMTANNSANCSSLLMQVE